MKKDEVVRSMSAAIMGKDHGREALEKKTFSDLMN